MGAGEIPCHVACGILRSLDRVRLAGWSRWLLVCSGAGAKEVCLGNPTGQTPLSTILKKLHFSKTIIQLTLVQLNWLSRWQSYYNMPSSRERSPTPLPKQPLWGRDAEPCLTSLTSLPVQDEVWRGPRFLGDLLKRQQQKVR